MPEKDEFQPKGGNFPVLIVASCKRLDRDFPDSPVIKMLPSNAGIVGSVPAYHRDLVMAGCGSGKQLHQGLQRLVECSERQAGRQLATHSSHHGKRQGGLSDATMRTSNR